MKFYKVVARPTLLYSSETWVTTTRDMTRLESAEMRFLRSVKGYTRLDKINEVIRKELEISGLQDVRSKHKIGSTILKEWTTPDSRNTPSTTNLEEEEIVDAVGNDGNASMPEQVNRPNPWRKMMMMKYSFWHPLESTDRGGRDTPIPPSNAPVIVNLVRMHWHTFPTASIRAHSYRGFRIPSVCACHLPGAYLYTHACSTSSWVWVHSASLSNCLC